VNASIDWCCRDQEEERAEYTKAVITELEQKDPDSFLEVATDSGYSTQSTPKMSAEFFTAMSDAMGLKCVQQRLLNQFLTEFYGKRQCVPEYELRNLSSHFIPFQMETLEFPIPDKPGKIKKVLYSWKDLSTIVEFYIENIMETSPELIKEIQICLGGDHGKGKFTFMALVAVRFKADAEVPDKILEFQIGQIDEETDTIEFLKPLLERLEVGIRRMNPSNMGKTTLSVSKKNGDGERTLNFDGSNDDYVFPVEFFMIGDLKYMFMVVGRSGYSGAHCLYCFLEKKDWKDKHIKNKTINPEVEEVTIEKLMERILQCQPDAGQDPDEAAKAISGLVGQKEEPLWTFIPVQNYLVPLLHLLLGLGNNLLDNYFSWLDYRIENRTPEEVEACNMALLAAIAVDEHNLLFREKKEALAEVVALRIEVNKKLKMKRSFSPEQIVSLEQEKVVIMAIASSTRQERDVLEKQVKATSKAKENADTKEREVRAKHGKRYKPVKQWIEDGPFARHKIEFSKYHGGKMEGPSIRALFRHAKEVFQEIGEHLIELPKITELEGTVVVAVDDQEIDEACKNHGEMAVLLDSVFSKLLTKRGRVSDEVLDTLEKDLLTSMTKWIQMGLSITPKFHVLLAHALAQLRRLRGIADMLEDAIERSHQSKYRDENRLSRSRNNTLIKTHKPDERMKEKSRELLR